MATVQWGYAQDSNEYKREEESNSRSHSTLHNVEGYGL